MSIHDIKTPWTITKDNGAEVTYYPTAARTLGQYKGTGYYPITTGGIVVGAVQKHGTEWIALVMLDDGNEVELDTFPQRFQAVLHVGTTKVAERAYREAGREGAWGTEVQDRIKAEDAAKKEQAVDYSQRPAPTTREDVVENPPAPVVTAPPAAAMQQLRIARAALSDALGILDAAPGDFSLMVSDVDDLIMGLDKVLRRNR